MLLCNFAQITVPLYFKWIFKFQLLELHLQLLLDCLQMLQMPFDPDRVIMAFSIEMDLQMDSQESWVIAHMLKCVRQRGIMGTVKGTKICLQCGDEKQEQVERI